MSTLAHWFRVLGISLTGSLSLVAGASAQVVFNVDSTLDQIDDDTSDGLCHTAAGTCTLRAAVMQANLATGLRATIVLPAGTYVLTRPATGNDGPDSGDLNFTSPGTANTALIEIVGAGESSTFIDANQQSRILSVHLYRGVDLYRLTIRNGRAGAASVHGGGIWNEGSLLLAHCTVSGNASATVGRGGGIYNIGELDLRDSTIRGNTTENEGGGIYNTFIASMSRTTIVSNVARSGGGVMSYDLFEASASTVALNTAHADGGGIYSYLGDLTLDNTTIHGNNADGSGGGLYVGNLAAKNANVFNSTIAFNGADADADQEGGNGGGIYVVDSSRFHMRNSLVVGNTLFDQPVYDDCWGTVNSYGRNLFWEPGDACFIMVQTGSAWILDSLDNLGPLQSNGGPTATVALLPGSNAIDGGDPDLGCIGPDLQPFATDQRGAARAVGARCDLGAFEHGALPAGYIFGDGFETGNLWAWSGA